MTGGAFVTESAEAVMVVVFALTAALVFAFRPAEPMMTAMSMTGRRVR